MKERVFNGTIKEGFKRRYTILNERDYQRYVNDDLKEKFDDMFNEVLKKIEEGRINKGKHPHNNYVVINLDELYIDEVVEIMKRNGHWG